MANLGRCPRLLHFAPVGAENPAWRPSRIAPTTVTTFNPPYSRETLSARIALIQVFRTFAAQSRDGLRFLHI